MSFQVELDTLKTAITLAGTATSDDKTSFNPITEQVEFVVYPNNLLELRSYNGISSVLQKNIPISLLKAGLEKPTRFLVPFKPLAQFIRFQNSNIKFQLDKPELRIRSKSGNLRLKFFEKPSENPNPFIKLTESAPKSKVTKLQTDELARNVKAVTPFVSGKDNVKPQHQGFFIYQDYVLGMTSTAGLRVATAAPFDLNHAIPTEALKILDKVPDDDVWVTYDDSKIYILTQNVLATHAYLQVQSNLDSIYGMIDQWISKAEENHESIIKITIPSADEFIDAISATRSFLENEWIVFTSEGTGKMEINSNNTQGNCDYLTQIPAEYDGQLAFNINAAKLTLLTKYLKKENVKEITLNLATDPGGNIIGPLYCYDHSFFFFSALGRFA